MPFYGKGRKVFKKGKRVFRRRRRGARISTWKAAGHLAKKAWAGFKYLKGMINCEKYKIDTSYSTTVGTTANVALLNNIATGDTANTRTGISVLLKYAYISLTFNRSTAATTAYSQLRMLLVQDTEQVGDTSPAYSDVIEGGLSSGLLNRDTMGRFTILLDKQLNLTANTPAIRVQQMVPLNFHARYNGTASSDIEKNGVYLMIVSSEATNQVGIVGVCRIAYYDN